MGPDTPSPPVPEPAFQTGEAAGNFARLLLAALTDVAGRSNRRQADLEAAMRFAGLEHDPRQIQEALNFLCRHGCIHNLVPLSDGGLLLTVTGGSIPLPGQAPPWLLADDE